MAGLSGVTDWLRRRRTAAAFIVGVTGAVACGKSTFSAALLTAIRAWPDRPRTELVCTDGFLFANAELETRGLSMRKGFPESFDLAALRGALDGARAEPTLFPAYSHTTYDIDPALARMLERPDVLIVEGLALAQVRGCLDVLIYLDAGEGDIETWFVARFLGLWEAAASDPTSFYARFRSLDRAGAEALARTVWREINLPNLRAHILPARALADLIVGKAADHAIAFVEEPPPGARP